MNWLNDSKACLSVAEQMINEIEVITYESIKDPALLPFLKVKIKNFLENCRSPLDYAAQYIFDEYCRTHYTERELRRLKVYYPYRKTESLLDVAIKENFRNLSLIRKDIVEIFKESQPFTNNYWLSYLTDLINENKHRNLSTQTKTQTTTIKHAQLGGVTITNSEMVNVKTPVHFNGTYINFINPSPYDHLFDASVNVEYFFTDLKLSVLPTLRQIFTGISLVINELEKVLKGG